MSDVTRIIKRDWSNCWATGQNLRETRWKRLRRAMWMAVYTCKGVSTGLRFLKHEQIGSHVVYDGEFWSVLNWAGAPYVTLIRDDHVIRDNVPREHIRQVWNWAELRHRLIFGFGWWMGSWFGIAVNKRLYPGAYRI